MQSPDPQQRALTIAGGIFLALCVILVTLAFAIDLSTVDLRTPLFISAASASFLFAYAVYTLALMTSKVEQRAEALANEYVESSEQLFTTVYYNSPVPYVLVDGDARIVSANRAALRFFGQPESRLRGLAIFDRIETPEPEHRNVLEEKYHNSIAIENEEALVHVADDRAVWTLFSLFDFVDRTGNSLGLLTLVDISRQKAVDTAKSEFVSLASHQLRTPITGMRWSAELLLVDQTEPLSDKQRQYVERLLESVRRMNRLVDDFLNVSRLELGTLTPDPTEVTLSELCDDVLREQQAHINMKQLTIERAYDAEIFAITTDRNLLRMAITNLVSNAIKYTPARGTVTITLARVDRDVTVSVADTGMGIPVAEQGRVFEKIFRASNAAKEVPDGTGLGLYIVKEVVEVLRGSITFTSAENLGTTFTIRLPRSL